MDDAAKHTVIPEILPLGMGYARTGTGLYPFINYARRHVLFYSADWYCVKHLSDSSEILDSSFGWTGEK